VNQLFTMVTTNDRSTFRIIDQHYR